MVTLSASISFMILKWVIDHWHYWRTASNESNLIELLNRRVDRVASVSSTMIACVMRSMQKKLVQEWKSTHVAFVLTIRSHNDHTHRLRAFTKESRAAAIVKEVIEKIGVRVVVALGHHRRRRIAIVVDTVRQCLDHHKSHAFIISIFGLTLIFLLLIGK